ncbi:FtsW/RodA/SpoVE family cell cycle protein [Metabacillus sp. RGM 3146]|uniref:FtsW/RodA/SpoVE family cell cycle protein n=1 Tax=Metabacillus sp. RGM 3146 TaxID=3401092 RepID=UPI003B99706E
MQKKNYFDSPLAFFIFLLMISSCICINSAQKFGQYHEDFFAKQILWFVLGTFIVLVIFLFDFDQLKRLSIPLYGFGILLLIGVLVAPESIAPIRNGAKSWFVLPGIGSVQPSEYMKIFMIMMLSKVVSEHLEKFEAGIMRNDVRLFFKIALVAIVPIGLTLKQDFGTSVVMMVITLGILFVSGVNWKIISGIALIGVMGLGTIVGLFIFDPQILLKIMGQYQLDRIYSWLDPFGNGQGIGYQLSQSILGIGSGNMYGAGFGHTSVYLPEAQSDFIFTIVGEDFGFLGSSIIVSLYFLIVYRIGTIALLNKRGNFEYFNCIGMMSLITFHSFQNIGMVSGLIPITGIPLPLMSYGGSSVMATLIGLGLVLNASLKKRDYMFSREG